MQQRVPLSLAVLSVLVLLHACSGQDVISDTCLLTKIGPDGKPVSYDINILSRV